MVSPKSTLRPASDSALTAIGSEDTAKIATSVVSQSGGGRVASATATVEAHNVTSKFSMCRHCD
jgi:hypothetical protein